MAFENVGQTVPGVVAAADLSADQFLFVVMSSTGIALNSSAGGKVLGVLQNKPTAGQAADVWADGSVSKVVASTAITKGAAITSTAAGKAVTATSGQNIAGYALDAAGADGDLISVFLAYRGTVP